MNPIRVGNDLLNKSFKVIDDAEQMSVKITYEVLELKGKYSNPNKDDVKSFYISHKRVALKNKSSNENENGYFESEISVSDF